MNAIIQCIFYGYGEKLIIFFIPLIKNFKKMPGEAGNVPLVNYKTSEWCTVMYCNVIMKTKIVKQYIFLNEDKDFLQLGKDY